MLQPSGGLLVHGVCVWQKSNFKLHVTAGCLAGLTQPHTFQYDLEKQLEPNWGWNDWLIRADMESSTLGFLDPVTQKIRVRVLIKTQAKPRVCCLSSVPALIHVLVLHACDMRLHDLAQLRACATPSGQTFALPSLAYVFRPIAISVKTLDAVQAPQGPWSAQPAQSTAGTDAVLALDDGSHLTAHSTFLQLASPQFSDALARCRPVKPPPVAAHAVPGTIGWFMTHSEAELRVPLLGTSRQQALLLLHCLYAWDRKSWAESLQPAELAMLARVAHKFGIAAVLQLADSALVKLCSTKDADASNTCVQMNLDRAPAQFQFARDTACLGFQEHVGRFMGAHAHALDLSKLDARSAALLKGACRLPRLP